MGIVSLDDICVTKLKQISTPGGDVMHALKASDSGLKTIGEVYFSWIEPKAIKAWKCHKNMTLNLVVPLGEVRFVFYLAKPKEEFRVETIGAERYVRLTVPPGIWFGFQGNASVSSLVMNIANLEHDQDEVLKKKISKIDYDWRI